MSAETVSERLAEIQAHLRDARDRDGELYLVTDAPKDLAWLVEEYRRLREVLDGEQCEPEPASGMPRPPAEEPRSRPGTADPSTARGTGVGGPEKPAQASDCVFCAILREDFPVGLITEWPDAIAIHPLNPVVEGHILIIPRVHVEDFASDVYVTSRAAGRAAEFVSRLREPMDFNLITSKGPAATQTVQHLHVHLVPRRPGDGPALPWTGQADRDAAHVTNQNAASLHALAEHRKRTATDALAHARAEGIEQAATALVRGLEDEGGTDGDA